MRIPRPPPTEAAIAASLEFLAFVQVVDLAPSRLAPSVVGGIGITFRRGDRRVYVEFKNDGVGHALFSAPEDEPFVVSVGTSEAEQARVLRQAQEFLDA